MQVDFSFPANPPHALASISNKGCILVSYLFHFMYYLLNFPAVNMIALLFLLISDIRLFQMEFLLFHIRLKFLIN